MGKGDRKLKRENQRLLNENRDLQLRIQSDRASFEETLAFAHYTVAMLVEDRQWLEALADERAERIAALTQQLCATEAALEALRVSGDHSKRSIGRIVMNCLAGMAAITAITGVSLKDLVDDRDEPTIALATVLSDDQRRELGIPVNLTGAIEELESGSSPSAADPASSDAPSVVLTLEPRTATELLGITLVNDSHRSVPVAVAASLEAYDGAFPPEVLEPDSDVVVRVRTGPGSVQTIRAINPLDREMWVGPQRDTDFHGPIPGD